MLALAVALSLFTTALFVLGIQRQHALAHDILERQAQAIAKNIAALVGHQVAANDRIGLASLLESFGEFEHIRAVMVTDRRETPLAGVRRNAAGNLRVVSANEIMIHAADNTTPRPGPHDVTPSLQVRADIGQIAPIGWVHLEYETSPLTAARTRMWVDVLLFLLTLACVFSAALLFASRCEEDGASRGPEDPAPRP